jgi:hypothetical protein
METPDPASPTSNAPSSEPPVVSALPVTMPPIVPGPVAELIAISEGNFPLAIAGGAVAALVGAAVWATVTIVVEYQIGWMAVGVGFLVGYAVRIAGKGHGQKFAFAGAAFAFVGCVLGNLFTVIGVIANHENVGFVSLLGRVMLRPGAVAGLMGETFSPMDLLFYGIAIYEGYKFASIRPAATSAT